MENSLESLNLPNYQENLTQKNKTENSELNLHPLIKDIIEENPPIKEAIEKYRDKCDQYTMEHIFSTANKSAALAEKLDLDPQHKKLLVQAALLHDIGKTEEKIRELVISPKKLQPEEIEIIQDHVRESIKYAQEIGMPPEVLQIIGAHHEENNGKSYPRKEERRKDSDYSGEERRSGQERRATPSEEIKKIIHVFSIIDRFDALYYQRSYKKALSPEESYEILKEQFKSEEDTKIIKLLLELENKKNISNESNDKVA
jgi:energy-coupling factor transport system substrate-specific component